MPISTRAALGLAVACAAAAVPASTASATVVAYSDNSNVVVENLDGSERRQVTTDGAFGSSYNHVGVNDAGDIAAIRSDGQSGLPTLHFFPAGGGEPKVNALPTWGSGIVTTTFNGRMKASSRLYAYSFGRSGFGGGTEVYGNVVPADAPGSPTGDGGGGFPDMLTATWHGENLVWSNGSSVAYGKGTESNAWFAASSAESYPWAEVSRDGSRLLYEINTGSGPNKLAYQAMTGPMPNQPDTSTGGCYLPITGEINGAALSADGRWAAWSESQVLHLAEIEIPPGTEETCTLKSRRTLSQKGDDPQFSEATLRPPGKPTGPAGPSGPTGPTGPSGPNGSKAKLKVSSTSLKRALRKGLTVTLTGMKPGRTTVKLKRGKRLMASKKARVPASGKAKVKLRFTKRAKKALKRVRRVKLTLSAGGVKTRIMLKK